jgi:hypothetical protein
VVAYWGVNIYNDPQMSTRNTDDAEVQRVVRSINYVTQEATLIGMTKNWSEADFLYGIERLDSDQPHDRREPLRVLYHKLHRERHAEEVRMDSEAANAKRHEELSRRLEELRKPHWSVVPNFWMTAGILILTTIAVIAAILGLRH